MVVQSYVKRFNPDVNPDDPAGIFHATPLYHRDLAVPSYASACSNVARFASACSCAFGILPTTATVSITLPAQSTTITNTATSTFVSTETDILTQTVSTTTTAVVATSTAVFSSFKIRAAGGPVNGEYLTDNVLGPGFNVPFFSASPASLTTCTIDHTNREVVCDGQIVNIIGSGQFFQLRDYNAAHILHCQIDSITFEFTCDPIVAPDIPHPTSQWYTCVYTIGNVDHQFLQQGINALNGCIPITLYADPI